VGECQAPVLGPFQGLIDQILAEFPKLAQEAADGNATFAQFLLRLTEREVAGPLGQRPGRRYQEGHLSDSAEHSLAGTGDGFRHAEKPLRV
jgi:hypothetical protein